MHAIKLMIPLSFIMCNKFVSEDLSVQKTTKSMLIWQKFPGCSHRSFRADNDMNLQQITSYFVFFLIIEIFRCKIGHNHVLNA